MEHEISGHSRKAYKIWKNPALPFWKKFRDILIEVLIIVFAVSLAAFLEKQREHSKEQKEVKEFLLGLQTDLSSDIFEMAGDKKSFNSSHALFSYIADRKPGEQVDKDSIRKYNQFLLNTTGLLVNDGRYQGFKSSGKIITIENRELQNDILDLYQENIPSLLLSTNGYTRRKEIFFEFLYDNVKRNPDGSSNLTAILSYDKAKNVCLTLASTNEIIDRYDVVINKSRKIIAAINHEYQK